MIENIAMRISDRLLSKSIIDEEQHDPVAYGLSLILSATVVTLSIFIIGIATGTFVQCLLYSAFFWTARNTVGLHHCTAYIRCFTLSVGLYSIMTISYLFTTSPRVIIIWLCMAACIQMYIAAEIMQIEDRAQRDNLKQRRIKLCCISFIGVVIALVALLLGSRAISYPISFGVFVISLLFVPTIHPDKKERVK